MAQTLQLTLSEELQRRLEARAAGESARLDEMALRLLAAVLPDETDRAERRRTLAAEVITAVTTAQSVEEVQRRAGYLCAAQDRLWQLWQDRPQEEELFGPLVAFLLDVLRLNPPERWTSEAFTVLRRALHVLAGNLSEDQLAEVVSAFNTVGLQTLPYPTTLVGHPHLLDRLSDLLIILDAPAHAEVLAFDHLFELLCEAVGKPGWVLPSWRTRSNL